MDSLPVELLQLILDYCDPTSVQSLRLVTPLLADLGYEYLIPPTFHALPYRDDLARLRCIANHRRLRSSIQSITFNFTEIRALNARHLALARKGVPDPDCLDDDPLRVWESYARCEQQRRHARPFVKNDAADVSAALLPLTNLRQLAVTLKSSPYGLDLLHRTMSPVNCCKMDHDAACQSLGLLLAGLQQAIADRSAAPTPPQTEGQEEGRQGEHGQDEDQPNKDKEDEAEHPFLESFSIDRLPMEMFKQKPDRSLWFQCDDLFAGLQRLNLALDTSNTSFPTARFRSVNGLGYVLRLAPQLTHLSLAFHNYARPSDKFILSLLELLGDGISGGHIISRDSSPQRSGARRPPPPLNTAVNSSSAAPVVRRRFCYANLTHLKLEGIACDERELFLFIMRHAATLERLRLGGRGMPATHHGPPCGGISLINGNFRSLFRRLRGRMPRLERLHLEGDFECETVIPHPLPTPTPSESPTSGNTSADEDGEPNQQTAATAAIPPVMATAALTNILGVNTRYERYMFYPTTDDDWEPLPLPRCQAMNGLRDSRDIEQYVLGISNSYPVHPQY